MADWGQRPKDKDREDAIKQIEAAAARGQIIDADKVKRIQEVRSAGTLGEIGMITRGLVLPAAAADSSSSTPPPVTPTFEPYAPQTGEAGPSMTPQPSVTYGEPLTPSAGTPYTPPMIKTSGSGGKLVLLFVLIMFAGIAVPMAIGFKALFDSDAIDSLGDLNPQKADVLTEEGIADLTEAVEERAGSTTVFRAVLYPEYAVVTVPADGRGKRSISYHWDGDLSESSKGSETFAGRVDMADIDFTVLDKALRKARNTVEDPTANYAIVSGPTQLEQGPTISGYASNDFRETGYVTVTLDGKVIREVKPE